MKTKLKICWFQNDDVTIDCIKTCLSFINFLDERTGGAFECVELETPLVSAFKRLSDYINLNENL